MSINESIGEDAALELFVELGYAVGHDQQQGLAALRASLLPII